MHVRAATVASLEGSRDRSFTRHLQPFYLTHLPMWLTGSHQTPLRRTRKRALGITPAPSSEYTEKNLEDSVVYQKLPDSPPGPKSLENREQSYLGRYSASMSHFEIFRECRVSINLAFGRSFVLLGASNWTLSDCCWRKMRIHQRLHFCKNSIVFLRRFDSFTNFQMTMKIWKFSRLFKHSFELHWAEFAKYLLRLGKKSERFFEILSEILLVAERLSEFRKKLQF